MLRDRGRLFLEQQDTRMLVVANFTGIWGFYVFIFKVCLYEGVLKSHRRVVKTMYTTFIQSSFQRSNLDIVDHVT